MVILLYDVIHRQANLTSFAFLNSLNWFYKRNIMTVYKLHPLFPESLDQSTTNPVLSLTAAKLQS